MIQRLAVIRICAFVAGVENFLQVIQEGLAVWQDEADGVSVLSCSAENDLGSPERGGRRVAGEVSKRHGRELWAERNEIGAAIDASDRQEASSAETVDGGE